MQPNDPQPFDGIHVLSKPDTQRERYFATQSARLDLILIVAVGVFMGAYAVIAMVTWT